MYPNSVDTISDMMINDEEIYEFVFSSMYSKVLNAVTIKVLKKSYMRYLRKQRLIKEAIVNSQKNIKSKSYNNFKYSFKNKNEKQIHEMFKNDSYSIKAAFQSCSSCRNDSRISDQYLTKLRKAILSYSIKIGDKKLQKRIEKHIKIEVNSG